MPARSASGKGCLSVLQVASFSLSPHMAFPWCVHVQREVISLPLLTKPPSLSHWDPALMTSLKLMTFYLQIHSPWGSGHQHMNWQGAREWHNSVHSRKKKRIVVYLTEVKLRAKAFSCSSSKHWWCVAGCLSLLAQVRHGSQKAPRSCRRTVGSQMSSGSVLVSDMFNFYFA